MKIAWRKITVFAFSAILILVVVAIWNPLEPRYQGRSLSSWAKDLNFHPELAEDPQKNLEIRQKHELAVAAVQHIGVRALPTALKLCRTRDFWIKKKLLWDLPDALHIDSDNWNISWEWDKQFTGAEIIQALGPVAEPVIPDLIKLFQSPSSSVAQNAVDALNGIGTNAIPPLVEALTSQDERTREYAARAVGSFRAQARAAVPGLLLCLKDKNVITRDNATRSLGQIGQNASVVVPALASCLGAATNHPSYVLSYALMWSIGRFGTNGQPAVPILEKIIESKQMGYLSALQTLHEIDPRLADVYFKQFGMTNRPISSP
jgi:hypothetical protein